MTFSQIQGNARVKAALLSMVREQKVPHALMFHDEDGGQAFSLCVAFLQYLYCANRSAADSCASCPSCNRISKLIHPDVHIIFPTASSTLSEQYMASFRELFASNPFFTSAQLSSQLKLESKKQMIAVDEAKRLLSVLSLGALEGGYRSVIVYLPEMMNAEAANRLLKIIEEPPAKTLFLFIVHKREKVLTTISSRCQHIELEKMRQDDYGFESFPSPELYDNLIDALCSRDHLAALDVAESLSALPSRDLARAFVRYAAFRLRSLFLAGQGLSEGSDAQDVRRAAALPKSFPRKALSCLDMTLSRMELNVNLKIMFTDLVNKLYSLI